MFLGQSDCAIRRVLVAPHIEGRAAAGACLSLPFLVPLINVLNKTLIAPLRKAVEPSSSENTNRVSLEDDNDFITATRRDVQDELLEGVFEDEDDANDDLGSTGCGPDESAIGPAPAPYVEVAEMFGDLEAIRRARGRRHSAMRNVSFHLRKRKWHV